jgi:hypothetical protein
MVTTATSHRAPTMSTSRTRPLLEALALVAAIAFVTLSLLRIAVSGLPMSVVDEHVHLDTAFKVHDGGYPHRGSLMGDDIVQEWACGVGHEAGGPAVPCGDPSLSADSLPSGKYTTGYIHYPTYFLGGEAFRWLVLPHGGDHGAIDAYRAWSAVALGLGMLACAGTGLASGLRGWALWAATLLPVASSGTFLLGTIVNPASTAILCGALLAWSGLRWMRTGRGFVWLAGATGFAAVIAVTDSLAALPFLLAALLTRVAPGIGPKLGMDLSRSAWRPRWWQLGTLASLILAPIVVWGRVIGAEATVSNDALYGAFPAQGADGLVRGALEEIFSPHSPWYEAQRLLAGQHSVLVQLLRAPALGIPNLVSILVLGLLAAYVFGLVRGDRPAQDPADDAAHDTARDDDAVDDEDPAPVRLLAVSALVTLMTYPAALRVSNTFNFGVDYGIVNRYSIGFAPLLVLLTLKLLPGRLVPRLLGALAVVCVAGLCAVAY